MSKRNTETDGSRVTNRRRFLRVAGAAGVTGLAGCSSGGGGGGSGGGESGSTTSGDGTTAGTSSGSGSNTVKIGAIYPLTGNLGEVGQNIQKILDTTVQNVVNRSMSSLGPLVLQQGEGLPNVNNRQVELIWADHRADPGQGRAEAERLIQSEGVDVLYGCYNSSVTKTVSAVAEREGIPMVTGESSSPELTERGLNWFWRTGPNDRTFTQNMFEFFNGLQERDNYDLEPTVAIIYEDTEFGSTSAAVQEELCQTYDYDIVAGPISYTAESVTSFTSQLNRIQQADPDILLPTSYVSDAILMAEDMQAMNYFPPIIMAQDSGHSEPNFISQTQLSNYFCTRSTFADDMTETVPEIGTYNQWLQDQVDIALNGVYIRSWGGLLTLMRVINDVGSADPGQVQSTMNSIQLERLVTGLPFGINFEDNGQNRLATGVLNQYHDGQQLAVWPSELAAEDTFAYPAPDWNER
jgi:branched-chain amino acid transport system substrate-binding protein